MDVTVAVLDTCPSSLLVRYHDCGSRCYKSTLLYLHSKITGGHNPDVLKDPTNEPHQRVTFDAWLLRLQRMSPCCSVPICSVGCFLRTHTHTHWSSILNASASQKELCPKGNTILKQYKLLPKANNPQAQNLATNRQSVLLSAGKGSAHCVNQNLIPFVFLHVEMQDLRTRIKNEHFSTAGLALLDRPNRAPAWSSCAVLLMPMSQTCH